ncbi:hypothetical protein DFH06DRAFT_1132296 [Mycena polygramma]|nr:hypothetical protein DFH06DRAFT_1132296 [Mycena polygramma]
MPQPPQPPSSTLIHLVHRMYSMLESSSSESEALVLSSANPAGDIRVPGPIMSLASSLSTSSSAPVVELTPSDGLPSYTHVPRTRRRLGSIPEEEVECKSTSSSIKAGQHPGLSAKVCEKVHCQKDTTQPPTSPIPSPRTAAPLKSRLKATMQKLFNTRKFAKRTQLAIPEARSWEGEKGISSNGAKMSSVMLMAAQSILEEDRKLRKKDRASEAPGSSTVQLASQVLQVQEEQRKERKQAWLEKLGTAPKKFVLLDLVFHSYNSFEPWEAESIREPPLSVCRKANVNLHSSVEERSCLRSASRKPGGDDKACYNTPKIPAIVTKTVNFIMLALRFHAPRCIPPNTGQRAIHISGRGRDNDRARNVNRVPAQPTRIEQREAFQHKRGRLQKSLKISAPELEGARLADRRHSKARRERVCDSEGREALDNAVPMSGPRGMGEGGRTSGWHGLQNQRTKSGADEDRDETLPLVVRYSPRTFTCRPKTPSVVHTGTRSASRRCDLRRAKGKSMEGAGPKFG